MIRVRPCVIVTAGLMAALCFGQTSTANLITNGSFEADGTVYYDNSGTLPPITGWSVTGQRVVVVDYEGSSDGTFAAVFDDGFAVDNGTGTSRPPSGSHTATISQSIAVLPNTTYAVHYHYGHFGGADPQKLRAQAGSLDVTEQVRTRGANGVGNLRQYRHVFTTGGACTQAVSFSDATTTGEIATADGVLDFVRVPNERVVYHLSFEVGQSNYTITSANANPAHAAVHSDPDYNGQASDGSQFMVFNGGGAGGNESNAIITSDAFATIPGETGHIYFDFGNFGGSGQGQTIHIELLDASTSLPYFTFNAFDPTNTTAAYTVLDSYELTYTAMASSTRLRISDILVGTVTPGNDGLLDNIIVTIPEPSGMMILALGGLPLMSRRLGQR